VTSPSTDSYRAQAKRIVSLSPGIHVRRLQRILGASFSTTRHHVGSLVRDGEILSARYGRYERLFPAGTAEGMKAIYAVLQSRNSRRVLQALAEGHSRVLSNAEISERTALRRGTVSECTSLLGEVQLVKRSMNADGRILFEVSDQEEALRLLAVFHINLLDLAADRFVDLWDF